MSQSLKCQVCQGARLFLFGLKGRYDLSEKREQYKERMDRALEKQECWSISTDEPDIVCVDCKAAYIVCRNCSYKDINDEYGYVNKKSPIVLCKFIGHDISSYVFKEQLEHFIEVVCETITMNNYLCKNTTSIISSYIYQPYMSFASQNIQGVTEKFLRDTLKKTYGSYFNSDAKNVLRGPDGGFSHDWECTVCSSNYCVSDK